LFKPKPLRGGDVFPDLSKHRFTTEEKYYLITQLTCPGGGDNKISHHLASKRYHIPRGTIRNWESTIKNGNVLHEKGGRPSDIDEIGLNEIIAVCNSAENARKPLSSSEVNVVVQEKIHGTKRRRNQLGRESSHQTIKKIKTMANICQKKPQLVSDARVEACSDLRMSYAMWIMLKAYTEFLHKQMIWNFDATQFISGMDSENQMACVVGNNRSSVPLSRIATESLEMAIKYMHMGSAAGECTPLVFLLAAPTLSEDAFFVYEIPGLTNTTIAGTIGYLAFCKTRCGNAAFFEWFITTIAIPTVVSSRKLNKCKVLFELVLGLIYSILTCLFRIQMDRRYEASYPATGSS
jgi:hypothetical protein